ncbi:hypothetical protein SAMN05428975_5540 [Mucilaginibacter sp. OK268]|jgi:hypothetical protein|uniref:hypothetical protein n=1 Tax=Mucilaginibacter sp. OK268 TaxID=1881048 RepID=UPI00088A81BE|nr:hypothetical protein [Mucilaginibacter sp. OK268]SDQ00890.1 hypothetical protein SAMN05428975_5540 [Mucilaginibacter sp. OK268]
MEITLWLLIAIGGPYLLLLYKKLGVSFRLVFISMMQLLIIMLLLVLVFITGSDKLMALLFPLSVIAMVAISINIVWIILIWIAKKS